MAKYELLYIIPGKYTEEELPNIINGVKEILNKNQVTLIKQEDLGKKKLAYQIGDSHYGYYILDIFSAEGQAIGQIDKALKLMPEVLRHQVVTYVDPAKTKGKTPKIKPLEERESPAPKAEDKKPETTIVDAIKQEPKEAEEAKKKEAAKPRIDLDKLDEKLDELLRDDLNI